MILYSNCDIIFHYNFYFVLFLYENYNNFYVIFIIYILEILSSFNSCNGVFFLVSLNNKKLNMFKSWIYLISTKILIETDNHKRTGCGSSF